MATYSRNGRMSQEDLLDQENQRRTEELASKVSHLKNIAFDIEHESKEQNKFLLPGMEGDFESSQGLLSGSMNRLNNMMGTGKNNRKIMCYIILGLVAAFLFFYFIISHLRTG